MINLGKSSTLAMLTGEFPPTTGEAYISGLNLSTSVHSCRRKIGFCPQFDALFELLTGREHLTLYARIKGINENDIVRVVNGKLKEMSLEEYADRAAGTYSGGNKRKLSVAIAMIGEPSIVFLDGTLIINKYLSTVINERFSMTCFYRTIHWYGPCRA
jgi:ABC-type multidrug transport system ATPase subunit